MTCSVDGCDRTDLKGHGLCRMHHKRWWKHGTTDDPLDGKVDFRRAEHPPSDVERFWQKVERTDSCWLWIGALAHGYGRLGTVPAHRFSYELHAGQIPDGLEIDHLCRTKRCVNPAHLEPVTHRENMVRHFASREPREVA